MSNRHHFETLYQFSLALHRHYANSEKMLQIILTAAADLAEVTRGCLATFNDERTIDSTLVLDRDGQTSAEDWKTLVERGLMGFALHAQRTVVVRNVAGDPRWPPQIADRRGSAIALPLNNGRRVFGVILLLHPEAGYFHDERTALLEEAVSLASLAIHNAADLKAARSGDTRYQSVFDDAVIPIILTDLQGTIIDINRKACDFLGWERHNLLKRPITTLHLSNADIEELVTIQQGEERAFRATAVGVDQTEIPVIVRVRRLFLGGRDVIEWVEQDITTQMELEQLRRDLSAMVYHDLRGPLQNIVGSLSKLGTVLANHENPMVLTLLQLGTRSTRQLRRMVDSLLDIQRLEEGKAVLDRQPMELRVLLADAVQLVQPLAWEANQRLHFDVKANIPLVQIDSDMMIRVVINLIENAVKYTPEGGTIRVAAEVEGTLARVSVSDSGPGIPVDMQHTIFDKFNRVKYHNAPQGVGLGLAFCRLAVHAHGGNIWVESEPGSGSDFIFTLPLAPVPAEGGESEFSVVL